MVMSPEFMAGNCLSVIQEMGNASSCACPLWLQAVFENAGRERGLLTREDLLLCASSCKALRFALLAMLPPGTPSYEGLLRTKLDLFLKGFREGLTVHTLVERLSWALRNGPKEAQTIAADFLRAHLGAVDSHDAHHAAQNDDGYSDRYLLLEAALEEILKHQPENVQVQLEQFLFQVVIDQAPDRRYQAHRRVHRTRLRELEGERRRRKRERERETESRSTL